MTPTRPITLGGETFEVPALPLRINRVVYPLCRELSDGGFIDRVIDAKGALACSQEEMDKLVEIAFHGASLADPDFTREAMDDLPVSPPELLDAFFVMRYQTQAWAEAPAGDEGQGEAEGAKAPRK